MTPRGTDWTLAVLVAVLAATGGLTLFSGPVVFAVHDVAGLALGGVLVWKLRRVWRRAFAHRLGPAAALLVIGTIATGVLWASAVHPRAFGYNPLNVHSVLGALLAAVVLAHAFARAKPPRRRDLASAGGSSLISAGVGAAALLAWQVQRVARPGEREAALHRLLRDRLVRGQRVPDDLVGGRPPATRSTTDYTPRRVARPRRSAPDELDAGDELTATLDCTGGFYSTQHWRGTAPRHGSSSDAPGDATSA